ncbi:MAG: stage III sporulation protein AB [Oscillospiraceae bacterium]|jgi:stage III sporulation protein AB|nr:stage III sporulation protein AB [Oscillospiraceae bacterium]
MKLPGAVLLVAACTLFGAAHASKLRLRQRCLAEILDALRFIDAELKNGSVPIPEIFAALKNVPYAVLRSFFEKLGESMSDFGERSLSEIWSGCVLSDAALSLSEGQRRELCRVGGYLGRYSETEQSEAIAVCIGRLEAEHLRSDQKARDGVRLYTGLGLTLGLMLAAVLL